MYRDESIVKTILRDEFICDKDDNELWKHNSLNK